MLENFILIHVLLLIWIHDVIEPIRFSIYEGGLDRNGLPLQYRVLEVLFVIASIALLQICYRYQYLLCQDILQVAGFQIFHIFYPFVFIAAFDDVVGRSILELSELEKSFELVVPKLYVRGAAVPLVYHDSFWQDLKHLLQISLEHFDLAFFKELLLVFHLDVVGIHSGSESHGQHAWEYLDEIILESSGIVVGYQPS